MGQTSALIVLMIALVETMTLPYIRRSKTTFTYSPDWDTIRRRTLRLQPRCTVNPMHKATIVHHVKNKRSLIRRIIGLLLLHPPKKTVSGFEISGWDVVSVCEKCHQNHYGRGSHHASVHHPSVWVQRGGLDNSNVWWFRIELRIRFWAIAFGVAVGRLLRGQG